ncbi:MAG: hypothetical protein KatS3mg076_2081 [Candidatus Binatia bacterium]|nr:MAG: hypothetical protein KatS3mg076_2081 [Candidatus Binatia bacterium]
MYRGDRYSGLFEPDALLPAQFYAAFRQASRVQGERHLMLAVLEDALDCYQKYAFAKDHHARQLFEEACQWIFSDDRDWPFSFQNICQTLEINPDWLREGLERWRRKALETGRGRRGQPIEPDVLAKAIGTEKHAAG